MEATRLVTDSFECGRLTKVGTPTGRGGRGIFAFVGFSVSADFNALINSAPVWKRS